MKFLGQGYEGLKHKQDRQRDTDTEADTHGETRSQTRQVIAVHGVTAVNCLALCRL